MKKAKSIRINEDLIKKVEKTAKKENRTFSNVINIIISDYYGKQKHK